MNVANLGLLRDANRERQVWRRRSELVAFEAHTTDSWRKLSTGF